MRVARAFIVLDGCSLAQMKSVSNVLFLWISCFILFHQIRFAGLDTEIRTVMTSPTLSKCAAVLKAKAVLKANDIDYIRY